jgi:hypothetical protein
VKIIDAIKDIVNVSKIIFNALPFVAANIAQIIKSPWIRRK